MGKGQELYKKAKTMIPGGTSLLSKRPEQLLPENWPAYYSKSKGCEVWDLDGNHYYDCSMMGIGTNTLGYANDAVDEIVVAREGGVEALAQGGEHADFLQHGHGHEDAKEEHDGGKVDA
jgi:glutamate-1-semialdehyde aminotransferase